jgi:hypothetical protein
MAAVGVHPVTDSASVVDLGGLQEIRPSPTSFAAAAAKHAQGMSR